MQPNPDAHTLREELVDTVIHDLLGPCAGEDEEIDVPRVRDRYLLGMRASRHQWVDPEEQDSMAEAGTEPGEEGTTEPEAPQTRTLMPSSFGLSFCAEGQAREILVRVRWGQYERVESKYLKTPTGAPKLMWRRRQIDGTVGPIPLADGEIGSLEVHPDYKDVHVRGLARRRETGWIVTLFLINGQKEPKPHGDAAWLFQPELSVESPRGEPIFFRYAAGPGSADAETARMAMIYRDRVEFAIGHGVSVRAEVGDPHNPDRAVRLVTDIVPRHEVQAVTPPTIGEIPKLDRVPLDMRELGSLEGPAIQRGLTLLHGAYGHWISTERVRLDRGDDGLGNHRDVARSALKGCEEAAARIKAGIDLLGRDPVALEAFRFMNKAMALQRVRTLLSESVRRGAPVALEEIDRIENRSWRPFQLAFILLNLPGVTDLDHPDRGEDGNAIADLLWFPTGGGKTEAYLGLTAYTLALRRLQGAIEGRSAESGVAVVMRYTLRPSRCSSSSAPPPSSAHARCSGATPSTPGIDAGEGSHSGSVSGWDGRPRPTPRRRATAR
jgi:hypothetical protein